jgi:acetolactate synthase-1/2/3 large subunit
VTIVNNNHCRKACATSTSPMKDAPNPTQRANATNAQTDFAKVAQSFDCFGVTVDKPQISEGVRSRDEIHCRR